MPNVSSVRLTAPKRAEGEITRQDILALVLGSKKNLVYVHAGAGFGKTTVLSQIAHSRDNIVWLTLDGESDIFTFVNTLSEAVRRTFPAYDFNVSEYLPFEGEDNFITILANAFLSSVEKLSPDLTLILDDLHTTANLQIKNLIACIMKYTPDDIRLCLSSREAPWPELISLRVRGKILELTQKELVFTKNETKQLLGFADENIYSLTEGWPLVIGSFKLLLENGVSLVDIPAVGNDALYTYLFYECISHLPSERVEFLKATACFEGLDTRMLDAVLNKTNTRLILESLVARNMFIIKTASGQYRYHPLFREYLLADADVSQKASLLHKALLYYFERKDYVKAADYAILSGDKAMLQRIILASYRDYIKNGNFSELRAWFQALEDAPIALNREMLVAKGAFLSSIGNFTAAKICLDTAIPLVEEDDWELYVEAMVHKARVLRNFISFEESNKLLDELIAKLSNLTDETGYFVVIEKLCNLCWNSQINEACALAIKMIETCAQAGNVKVKAWFERYLSAIHFFAGRMKDSVYYYEKSLELPETERHYLDTHSIGIYVAKAYQMLGERDKAVDMIKAELQRLRSTGRYEELWLGYLFAAEIHYQNSFIDRMNGGSQTFETTMKYFTLANEYAPLYRKTEFQMRWAKMQRLVYSLMFTDSPKESVINEIFADLDQVGDYFKTIALARLFGYFAATSDFPRAVKCARLCIEIGERANLMLLPTLAYGILARAAIATKDQVQSVRLTKRYLQLCSENGIYEYFRMRKAYDPILEFAFDNGIEPEITQQMMDFAGFKTKKVYIETLGSFTVYPFHNRQESLKMRTKKERELLAFLLDAGSQGVTKEQIFQALCSESESEDVKKMIGVNLAHIKKNLADLGIENALVNREKHYSICRDQIVLDVDLFETVLQDFQQQNSREAAQKILSLYKGEYLADFEALWAVSKRIRYDQAYEAALSFTRKFEQ